MLGIRRLLSWLAASAVLGQAALYDNIKQLPSGLSFDFIIVGGGTAGSVLANRLSENPQHNVLLIDAGPSNADVLLTMVPGYNWRLRHTQYYWNYTTIPQKGLNGRVFNYDRGHVLGGSSSVNAMFYTRGASSDYDRWANVTGDDGWSWSVSSHTCSRWRS
ncbi:hypothetical protein FA15DRAFT_438208 [Coprinopsis marcescibilis]|uniref:Glucose-methanol-choline oxidoreductase N-terminal domain-containing protein n=1 Tax=Coprinopsis marcescibilis TaxID=230819 RepID=A0A5C3KTT7_COPMA|nr:hypothetical protein FA15DRAFT_438208 [Coprinopsis marcescibilis]